MTADAECRYYGRDFTTQEMVVLRALIAASPPPNRHALSREFNRRRTSGSDPCGRTGGALSTGEIMVLRQPLRPFITP